MFRCPTSGLGARTEVVPSVLRRTARMLVLCLAATAATAAGCTQGPGPATGIVVDSVRGTGNSADGISATSYVNVRRKDGQMWTVDLSDDQQRRCPVGARYPACLRKRR